MSILGIELWQLALIAGTAFCAQTVGGVAGYGAGMLMPLVLIPIIGPEAIVPVISLSALITNPTRIIVFRAQIDWRKALSIAAYATPTTMLGAWGYTRLSGTGASLVIGAALIFTVPLRRFLARRRFVVSGAGFGVASAVYGFLTGAMTGAGVVLISLLMSMGLPGRAVIATDALASTIVGFAKTGVFVAAGELPAKLWLVAGIIGLMAMPATLVARWLMERFSARLHNFMLEAAIVAGGLVLVVRAIASVV